MAFMRIATESTAYKQLLRDMRTGEFLTASGAWSVDEKIAANCLSAFRILQFCIAHPERRLELVLKTPGEPDLSVALTQGMFVAE